MKLPEKIYESQNKIVEWPILGMKEQKKLADEIENNIEGGEKPCCAYNAKFMGPICNKHKIIKFLIGK
jgi:hypothetical protein